MTALDNFAKSVYHFLYEDLRDRGDKKLIILSLFDSTYVLFDKV